jgi:hypothetical protein
MSTTLDLSLTARPLDALSGRAMFRLHNDWRNMHTSAKTPVTARWLSIDGHINSMVLYNVGDFTSRISPYTIWAPEPTILFEPEIFARNRRVVMDEVFLGNNNRALQGINLRVPLSLDPVLDVFDLTVLGARLNAPATDDPFAPSEDDPTYLDKYLFTSNLDMIIVEGVSLGGTYMYNGEVLETFGDTGDVDSRREFSQQKNRVTALRGGLDSDLFGGFDAVSFGLDGEAAFSQYENIAQLYENGEITEDEDRTSVDVSGSALRVGAQAGLKLSSNSFQLEGAFLNNGKDFVNELAQSPVFWRENVINTEALPGDAGLYNLNYNTFNALYRNVYHFAPSGDNADRLDFQKRPMNKIAWTRALFGTEDSEELLGSRGYLTMEDHQYNNFGMVDNTLMPLMPLGEATPNRTGIALDLNGDIQEKMIRFSATAKMFSQIDGDEISYEDGGNTVSEQLNETDYTQFGGGLSMDIARFGDWYSRHFILSGSYLFSDISGQIGVLEEDEDGNVTTREPEYTETINFLNLGMYFKFHERMALMGGYQLLGSSNDGTEVDHDLGQWSTGLEFTVREGAKITTTYGMIDNSYSIGDTNYSAESKQFDLLMTMKF